MRLGSTCVSRSLRSEALDPLQDRRGVVGELDGGRELDVEDPLLARQRLELLDDHRELVRPALLRGKEQELRTSSPTLRISAATRSCVSISGLSSSARSSGIVGSEELLELLPDRVQVALLLRGLESALA